MGENSWSRRDIVSLCVKLAPDSRFLIHNTNTNLNLTNNSLEPGTKFALALLFDDFAIDTILTVTISFRNMLLEYFSTRFDKEDSDH